MQKRTAAKVADLLGLVEAYLEDGRPRKHPGKSRPEGISIHGDPIKITGRNFWDIEKVSLVGAIKMACFEQGYTKRVRDEAGAWLASVRWPITYSRAGLQGVDDVEWDTRRIIRDARAARKALERRYAL